jgi:hypothetical protein
MAGRASAPVMAQTASSTTGGQLFLARAPISTRQQRVLGYQIRVGRRTGAPVGDPAAATDASQVGQILGSVGTETLTQNRLAFLRVTRHDLLGQSYENCQTKSVVFELSGSMQVDAAVKSACADLRTHADFVWRSTISRSRRRRPTLRRTPTSCRSMSATAPPGRDGGPHRRLLSSKPRRPSLPKVSNDRTRPRRPRRTASSAFRVSSSAGRCCCRGRQISPQQITALRLLRAAERSESVARTNRGSRQARRHAVLPHPARGKFRGVRHAGHRVLHARGTAAARARYVSPLGVAVGGRIARRHGRIPNWSHVDAARPALRTAGGQRLRRRDLRPGVSARHLLAILDTNRRSADAENRR